MTFFKKFNTFDFSSETETKSIMLSLVTTKYFIGCVTLFFGNNYSTEYRITMEFLHKFFRPWRNF